MGPHSSDRSTLASHFWALFICSCSLPNISSLDMVLVSGQCEEAPAELSSVTHNKGRCIPTVSTLRLGRGNLPSLRAASRRLAQRHHVVLLSALPSPQFQSAWFFAERWGNPILSNDGFKHQCKRFMPVGKNGTTKYCRKQNAACTHGEKGSTGFKS